jgi:UDP:flavonoid glycosyltransferase YjiC (YdhE family)
VGRVLFAWELGGDSGHARRIFSVARDLRALGHDAALAFRDLAPLGRAALDDMAWFPAPWLVPPARPDPSPLNASDILLNSGFADAAGLEQALRAWLSLFRLWRVDAVVADSAPAALLAARIARIPRMNLAGGFGVPRPASPMPALRPWLPSDPAELQARDARLVASVREAVSRADPGSAAPSEAAEVFAADANLLCTWPELDPFGPRDGVEYLGPQADSQAPSMVEWRGDSRPRIVACLEPRDPRFAAVVAAIGRVAGEAVIAAPGLAADDAKALSTATMRVLGVAIDPSPLLRDADLGVSPGDAGFTLPALAAGVPLALLPMHLEQYLAALRVKELGAGAMVSPVDPAPDFSAWLAAAAASSAFRDAARAAAPALGRPSTSAAQRVASLIGA